MTHSLAGAAENSRPNDALDKKPGGVAGVLDALVWINVGSSDVLVGRRWTDANGMKSVEWYVSDAIVASNILLVEHLGDETE